MKNYIQRILFSVAIGVVTLFLSVTNASPTPSDPKEMFAEIQQSYSNVNFELLFARVHSSFAEPVKYVNGVIDNERYSFWSYQNNAKSGFFFGKNKVVYYSSGQKNVMINNGSLPFISNRFSTVDLDKFFENYNVNLIGYNRIADRQVASLFITSKNKDRYSYLVHVDLQSKVIIHVDVYNLQGSVVQAYVGVDFKVLNKCSEVINNVKRDLESISETNNHNIDKIQKSKKLDWNLDYIPSGFEKVYEGEGELDTDSKFEQYMFSDGVIEFSVYKIKYLGSSYFPIVKQGVTNLARKNFNEYEFVVVGEIPIEIANRILDALVVK